MKKIILNSLIIALTLGVSVTADAETRATTTRGQIREARQEAKTEIKEIREKLASTTRDIRDSLKDAVKNKIEKRFGKMFDRLQSTIERETSIMKKISSRIDKIKAEGGSTTEAEKLVSEAKMHLDEAQKALDAMKATAINDKEIASSTENKVSKETAKSMSDAVKNTEKHLRAAHEDLQKTVGILKGVSQLKNASSTKETN